MIAIKSSEGGPEQPVTRRANSSGAHAAGASHYDHLNAARTVLKRILRGKERRLRADGRALLLCTASCCDERKLGARTDAAASGHSDRGRWM